MYSGSADFMSRGSHFLCFEAETFWRDIISMEKLIVRFLEFGSDKYAYMKHLPANSRVLDVGCGDCRRLRYRSYHRNDLIQHGIDVQEDRGCKKHLATFHALDIAKETLPFEEEYFDLVVMSHVLEHLPRSDFLFCLREIKRVLRGGGYFYIEFPSEKTSRFVTAKTLKRYALPVTTLNFYDDDTHVSLYSVQEVIGILEGESLKVHRYGDVREPVKKCLAPLLIVAGCILRNESVVTGALWSLVNWASFIVAKKEGSRS